MPQLPKNFLTWLMLMLLLILAGIAIWIYWALGQVEEAKTKGPVKRRPTATEQDSRI